MKKPYLYMGALVVLFCLVQIFGVSPFLSDKSIVSTQLIQSMFERSSLVGWDMPCIPNAFGEQKSFARWAEEPPLYHLLGMIFPLLSLETLIVKIYPLICFLLVSLGLYKTALLMVGDQKLKKAQTEGVLWSLGALSLLQPYIIRHATRPLPDNLSLVFLVWFYYFFHQKKYPWSLLFAFLAATTKALALFPMAFICLSLLVDERGKITDQFTKKSLLALGHGLGVLSTVAWLIYLRAEGIENPFFPVNPINALQGDVSIQHTGGFNFSDLASTFYWSRLTSWVALKGVGPVMFIGTLWCLFMKSVKKPQTLGLALLGHLVYVLVVRGPQRSAPWYSFYFLPFYYFLFCLLFVQLKRRGKILLLSIQLLWSLFSFKLHLKDIKKNVFIPISKSSRSIPCHFHQWLTDKHRREGRL